MPKDSALSLAILDGKLFLNNVWISYRSAKRHTISARPTPSARAPHADQGVNLSFLSPVSAAWSSRRPLIGIKINDDHPPLRRQSRTTSSPGMARRTLTLSLSHPSRAVLLPSFSRTPSQPVPPFLAPCVEVKASNNEINVIQCRIYDNSLSKQVRFVVIVFYGNAIAFV